MVCSTFEAVEASAIESERKEMENLRDCDEYAMLNSSTQSFSRCASCCYLLLKTTKVTFDLCGITSDDYVKFSEHCWQSCFLLFGNFVSIKKDELKLL